MCFFNAPVAPTPQILRPTPAPEPLTTDVLAPGQADADQVPPMTADLYQSLLSRLRVPVGTVGEGFGPQTAGAQGSGAPTGLGFGRIQ